MKLPQFFIAIAACFLVGFGLLVLVPMLKLGGEGPLVTEDGIILPPTPNGMALTGEMVFRDQGCIYCHSQVALDPKFGPDVEKGWAPRPTVSRDYINRQEAYLGIRRFGPDLAFAGWEDRGYTRERLYQHLFDPRINSPMSNAPSYRFLFVEKEIKVAPSEDAIDASRSELFAPREGYEIVPKRAATELVEYLLSLNPNYALPEAALPEAEAETPAPAEGAPPPEATAAAN